MHRITLAENYILAVDVDSELSPDDVDKLRALMFVGFGRLRLHRELGIERLHLAVGDWEIEAFEEIGRRFSTGPVRQANAIVLPDHRHGSAFAAFDKEVLQTDAEHQCNSKQRW